MDADEEVGLHPLRLAHTFVQRHEEVGVARQHHAHAGHGIELAAQRQGDRQHDVFFAQAGGADGAGVFTAVAGVERDDDETVDTLAFAGGGRRWG